jgi:DNA repair protein RecN (Recombination protein N)
MTAKEYLNQAYWLDRRIDSKLEQLSALKDMATKTTSIMSDDVVSHTRNVHSMQDVIAKIIDMQAEINADIDRLVDLKRDIMQVVKTVDDPELQTLLELDEKLEKTGAEHRKLLSNYRKAARELTASRKQIAETFTQQMMKELKDLGMEHTVIEVAFEEKTDGKPVMPTPGGDDRVCFMISPNPGEPLKPMAKIASGGELSRLMLAMKTIEAGRGGTQTMIFDEIDTGISGRMAQAVAEKMILISRRQQVICISHLPQIAAAADHQILVHKGVRDGRTMTETDELTGEERIREVARMISGAEGITEDAKQYAGQMIEAADRRKREI